MSADELRVLWLAVNRLSEKGQWDLGALRVEFEELILTYAPIEVGGFTVDEIDHIVMGEDAEGLEEGPTSLYHGRLRFRVRLQLTQVFFGPRVANNGFLLRRE